MTIRAVYRDGVFRPEQPLSLAEGERVELTVAPVRATPLASEEELVRRIQACKTYREWLEVTKSLPPDDGGYDIAKAVDENGRWSCHRAVLTGS